MLIETETDKNTFVHRAGITIKSWSDQGHPINSVIITLNLLPLLGGGRANLKTSEKDLVTVLPHDEGADGTDECLGQVQHDLEQEVECEGPSYHLTVADSLVGKGASYRVILMQFANAILSHMLTAEATGLWVVMSSKRHDQHWNDQANCTQDEVQKL